MNYRLTIYRQGRADASRWESLVTSSDSTLPFASADYISIFDPVNVFFIVAEESDTGEYLGGVAGRLKGSAPIIGNLFAIILLEMSVVINRNRAGTLSEKIERDIYDRLISFATEQNVTYIYLNHWSRIKSDTLLSQLGFITSENHTLVLQLQYDRNDIASQYASRCRNAIKRAINKGVTVGVFAGADALPFIRQICDMSRETWVRAGTRNRNSSMQIRSAEFYKNLFLNMDKKAVLGIASTGDNLIAAFAIMLTSGKRMVYYRGGSDIELNRLYAASSLLLHKLVEYANSTGVPMVDFGGIPVYPTEEHPAYGVYKFKQSFGGELEICFRGDYILKHLRYRVLSFLLNKPRLIRIFNSLRPVS